MKRLLCAAFLFVHLSLALFPQSNPPMFRNKDVLKYERLRIGVNLGLGYLWGNSENVVEEMVSNGLTQDKAKAYQRDLKSGYIGNGELTYLFSQYFGIGIKYKFLSTSAATEGFYDNLNLMELYYGNYYEQIYVNFAGPAFLYQYTFNSKKSFKLSSVVSLGVTTYRNEGRKVINYYLLTGNNFGADVSFDSEYFITRNLSVDFGISELFSSIRKVEFSNGLRTSEIKLEKDKYKNLSRLDLSVGIRFYLLDK